jgi:protein-disulfide reductase (glutathione)
MQRNRIGRTLASASVAALFLICTAVTGVRMAAAGGDWNDDGIQWRSLDEGLELAKKEKKPVCLIFYTEWCPHCTNYSKVFHDSRVVDVAKKLVMVRIDGDKDKELSKQYALDGAYIPRTYFLSSDGKVDDSIHAPRDRYKYFYNEHDAGEVLASMQAALKKQN